MDVTFCLDIRKDHVTEPLLFKHLDVIPRLGEIVNLMLRKGEGEPDVDVAGKVSDVDHFISRTEHYIVVTLENLEFDPEGAREMFLR